jgi:hypothetical protein
MHHDDTLTAFGPNGSSTPCGVDPFDDPRSSRPGEFAAGLRTRSLDDCAHRSFATGVARALLLGAGPIGDFAGGVSSPSRARVVGDFATGRTAPNNGEPRHGAVDRPDTGRWTDQVPSATAGGCTGQPREHAVARRSAGELIASDGTVHHVTHRAVPVAVGVGVAGVAGRCLTAPPRPAAARARARRSPVAANPRSATRAARPTAPQH